MSVIYRPQRGSLKQAMEEAKIFESVDEMFDYLCTCFEYNKEDFFLSKEIIDDTRINWHHTQEVLLSFGKDNNGELHAFVIGFCDCDYQDI